MRLLAALLFAPLALFAADCAAQTYAIRIGTEKIVLEPPPGFADTTNLASPRLQDFAENMNSQSNRVVLFGLTDADLRRFQLGDKIEVNRFVMITTPRTYEQQRISADQFAAYARDSVGALGKPVQTQDLIKYLEGQPVGRTSLLDELRREPAAVSVMQATRLNPLPGYTFWERAKPQYLVFTTTQLLVRNKVLQLQLFTLGDFMPDTDWIRVTTLRWAEDLQRLNPR
jgi:hypothetical protein